MFVSFWVFKRSKRSKQAVLNPGFRQVRAASYLGFAALFLILTLTVLRDRAPGPRGPSAASYLGVAAWRSSSRLLPFYVHEGRM